MNDKISKLFNHWMTEGNTEDETIFDYMEGDDNAIPFYGGYKSRDEEIKQLENIIRDMLFDIPVIPDRYKYVNRLKEIVK